MRMAFGIGVLGSSSEDLGSWAAGLILGALSDGSSSFAFLGFGASFRCFFSRFGVRQGVNCVGSTSYC